MRCERRIVRLEITGPGSHPVQWFDTAAEAMTAVSRLCAERVEGLVIEDGDGLVLSVAQLAALAGERRAAPPERPAVA